MQISFQIPSVPTFSINKTHIFFLSLRTKLGLSVFTGLLGSLLFFKVMTISQGATEREKEYHSDRFTPLHSRLIFYAFMFMFHLLVWGQL